MSHTIKLPGGREAIIGGTLYLKCPKCRKAKPLGEFSFRTMANGEMRNQSQCKACQ